MDSMQQPGGSAAHTSRSAAGHLLTGGRDPKGKCAGTPAQTFEVVIDYDGAIIRVEPETVYLCRGDTLEFSCGTEDWEVELKGKDSPFKGGKKAFRGGRGQKDGSQVEKAHRQDPTTYAYKVKVDGKVLDPDIVIKPDGP